MDRNGWDRQEAEFLPAAKVVQSRICGNILYPAPPFAARIKYDSLKSYFGVFLQHCEKEEE
jgi:hypothetical protein